MRIDYEVAYNLLATVNEELIARIKQLEAERQKWFDSSRDADLECIRLRREIKQLKEEFEMITKDRDERVHELYESNEENHRLTKAIDIIEKWNSSKSNKYDKQSAIEQAIDNKKAVKGE